MINFNIFLGAGKDKLIKGDNRPKVPEISEVPQTVIKVEEPPVVRKSEKYKSFPKESYMMFGNEIEKKYDKIPDSIRAQIRHLMNDIDNYLLPEDSYKIDQNLALQLETSLDELATLFLEIVPNYSYAYQDIVPFAKRLEEIYNLIIDAKQPLYKEREGRYLEDPNAKLANVKYVDYSDKEKDNLHQEGVGMLSEALENINNLNQFLKKNSNLNLDSKI